MKLVMIAYNEAVDDDILKILDDHGIEGYTKWTKVYGQGRGSGPHLGTHVWPKANNVIAAALEPAQSDAVMSDVRALRARMSHQGIKAFVLPLEEWT